MKQNHYLYKIAIDDNYQKKKKKKEKEKRNEVKKLTQGHNIESKITTNICAYILIQGINLVLNFCLFLFYDKYGNLFTNGTGPSMK